LASTIKAAEDVAALSEVLKTFEGHLAENAMVDDWSRGKLKVDSSLFLQPRFLL